jgi:hypothetical protein
MFKETKHFLKSKWHKNETFIKRIPKISIQINILSLEYLNLH